MMRVELTGRHVEITPALRQLIARRLQKLDRLLNERALSAHVALSVQRHRHVADVTVHARGEHVLSGTGRGDTWPLSIKDAVEKVTQQAHTLKEKGESRRRRRTRTPTPADGAPARGRLAAEAAEPPAAPRIVRMRRTAVKPMNVEDAALRVEGAREPFLVFRNAATDAVNIIYRRRDGHFGLIEPEV